MNNHIHFIRVPQKEDSLAKVFSSARMRYSQYYNKRLKTGGHLWQGRFYSCYWNMNICIKHSGMWRGIR
ncbi:MAG: transposase [Proteobacteria bacterium]|nr:transposase [Pseudomonadota bacterium]